jgi:hypothetical protein
MNTKFQTIAIFFLVVAMAVFSSCEEDDDVSPIPTISELELGIDDSHVAYINADLEMEADLHIEAEVVAEGLFSTIEVEIHAEDGSDNEIDTIYDYSDQTLKNTTFHEHIEIPYDFPIGDYHFHFTVTDKEGNSTTIEEELSIEELTDEEAPEITISSAPTDAQAFVSGETISISGTVEDNILLAGMVIALVYEDDNIADANVAGDNTHVIVMLHTHTFDSKASHSFEASIEVEADYDNNMTPALIQSDNAWKSGNYYILVKSIDAMGNWAYSNYYPIVINL